MARLKDWFVLFGHNAALQRLIVAAVPLAGSRPFPLLGGLLSSPWWIRR
jgi:hypothetical protein